MVPLTVTLTLFLLLTLCCLLEGRINFVDMLYWVFCSISTVGEPMTGMRASQIGDKDETGEVVLGLSLDNLCLLIPWSSRVPLHPHGVLAGYGDITPTTWFSQMLTILYLVPSPSTLCYPNAATSCLVLTSLPSPPPLRCMGYPCSRLTLYASTTSFICKPQVHCATYHERPPPSPSPSPSPGAFVWHV